VDSIAIPAPAHQFISTSSVWSLCLLESHEDHEYPPNPQPETPISLYFPNCPPSLPLWLPQLLPQKIHSSLFFFISFIARYSHKTHLQNLHSFKNWSSIFWKQWRRRRRRRGEELSNQLNRIRGLGPRRCGLPEHTEIGGVFNVCCCHWSRLFLEQFSLNWGLILIHLINFYVGLCLLPFVVFYYYFWSTGLLEFIAGL